MSGVILRIHDFYANFVASHIFAKEIIQIKNYSNGNCETKKRRRRINVSEMFATRN